MSRALSIHAADPWAALAPGLCIFAAAFLLTWAAEAAEVDLPQSLSIGIVALIAVLPEYAVDMYFAWKAGKFAHYTAYATANMTGANRMLIGLGWPAVLFAAWRSRGMDEVRLGERNALELSTLLLATIYAFLFPMRGALTVLDSAVFFALFSIYAWLASRSEVEEPELEGPALMIARWPAFWRRTAIVLMFAFSAVSIILSAEPFAEGILAAGRSWGVEQFMLVQWLAPLASEAPEFIVAILFALKGKPAVGLRALVSSKVNQWTLLIGMLPVAYNVSLGHVAPMPLDARQVEEIFLTSAQSLFGLAILMNFRFSFGEAAALAALFLSQIFFPSAHIRYFFAGAYMALASFLMFQENRRGHLAGLLSKVRKMIS